MLTLGAEVRYQLYDGAIFAHRYGLTEAAINTSLWAGLALAYYRRGLVSAHLAALYRVASRILLVMSLASYAVAAVIHNPWWSTEHIGSTTGVQSPAAGVRTARDHGPSGRALPRTWRCAAPRWVWRVSPCCCSRHWKYATCGKVVPTQPECADRRR